MDKILSLLGRNARLTNNQIAVMLGLKEHDVAEKIAQLEADGVICGYHTLINWNKANHEFVTALIELRVSPRPDSGFDAIAKAVMEFEEVESVFLMSGGYDLCVMVTAHTFQEVALFVAKRLSTMDSVLSTATHFVLSRYKEAGISMLTPPEDERRSFTL
ncbi:MAG: Lrp/AsnC family transcriptional regulator [Clostridiales bacterium]|nr:Lrp/AsnC family transcriptional regulator [Clostridiales bacterium]